MTPPWREALLSLGHNRPGTRFPAGRPNGLVLHSTATPGATAQQIRDDWQNNPWVEASAHLAVDDQEALLLIPALQAPARPAEIAWHAGYTANHRFLGMELCEFPEPARASAAYGRWLDVAGFLCAVWGWDSHLAVFSHRWCSETFHETDHTDPYPYFTHLGVTWEECLDGVRKAKLKWIEILTPSATPEVGA